MYFSDPKEQLKDDTPVFTGAMTEMAGFQGI